MKNFDSEKWWYPYGGDQIGKKWIPNALNPINCPANERMLKDIEIIFWIFFAQIIWGIFGTVVGCPILPLINHLQDLNLVFISSFIAIKVNVMV